VKLRFFVFSAVALRIIFVSICQPCVDKFSVPVANFGGVESLEEKEMDLIAEKVALKVGEKSSLENEKLKTELSKAKSKLVEAEGKIKAIEAARDEANGKLAASNKPVEKLRNMIPAGLELLADPPVLMPVVEHIAILEKRLPSVMAERSSLGLQLHAQEMRGAIIQAKERLKAK
jgi:hypothetical protein